MDRAVLVSPSPPSRGKRDTYSRLINLERGDPNGPLSHLWKEKNQPPFADHSPTRPATRNGSNALRALETISRTSSLRTRNSRPRYLIETVESRDPSNDLSPLALPGADTASGTKKRRESSSSSVRETKSTTPTRRGLRRKSEHRRHNHSINESVSFVGGDNGNAVTSVNHYQIYSDKEKKACFYDERDFRRFRAEHYLGIKPGRTDEQSSAPEYEKAANDFVLLMCDMWNSFLDMAYSSLHG